MQLFRFDNHYLSLFFKYPGGLSTLIASFLVQFYIFPWMGACILLLIIFIYYLLQNLILLRFNISTFFITLVSIPLFAVLQTQSNYPLSSSIAFLFALVFFLFYINIKNKNIRLIAIALMPGLLFIVSGSFVYWFIFSITLYELLNNSKDKIKKWHLFPALLIGLVSNFVLYKALFILTPIQANTACFPFFKLNPLCSSYFISLLVCIPLSIIINRCSSKQKNKPLNKFLCIFFYPALFLLTWFSYDYKTEKLFQIEYLFQKKDYKAVTEKVKKYPGNNHLVIYWGNIALSKTKQMGESLFEFRQVFGQTGLTMKGEPVNIASLYGADIYDHLRYTNEARHLAYEGFVSNGATPHLIKSLVKYELANGNYQLAKKYLKLLSQTLFYKKWALEYYKYIESPLLIVSDDELAEMRKYTPYEDFYHDELGMRLKALLTLYPANRAAFDYMIANSLLKKDLKGFVSALDYLTEFPMRNLPTIYEEALLVFENIFPEDKSLISKFDIREETRERFNQYVYFFQTSKGKEKEAFRKLSKEFGNTFWFYLDFYPIINDKQDDNNMILY